MKWGNRRYQYKDGSLTPEGKKRYLKEATSSEKVINASVGPRLKETASSEKLLSMKIESVQDKYKTLGEKFVSSYMS